MPFCGEKPSDFTSCFIFPENLRHEQRWIFSKIYKHDTNTCTPLFDCINRLKYELRVPFLLADLAVLLSSIHFGKKFCFLLPDCVLFWESNKHPGKLALSFCFTFRLTVYLLQKCQGCGYAFFVCFVFLLCQGTRKRDWSMLSLLPIESRSCGINFILWHFKEWEGFHYKNRRDEVGQLCFQFIKSYSCV